LKPAHRPFQPGDIRHSRADISKARRLLGYAPIHDIDTGLDETLAWHLAKHSKQRPNRDVPKQVSNL